MQSSQPSSTLVGARLLLRETNKSLRDIALRLLFVDEDAFITYFYRQTEVTPLEYRKNHVPCLQAKNKPSTKTVRIDLAFPDMVVREKTLWLPDGYLPVCDDITGIVIERADVHYTNGDIVRVRRFETAVFKSAMQRLDSVGNIGYGKRQNTVRFSVAQQTNELTVSAVGANCITQVDAQVTFTQRGPR